MTKKQMRKLAKEIVECEMIHSDETTSKEEKLRAENRIMQLTNWIMALPNGVSSMLEIDSMAQQMMNKN